MGTPRGISPGVDWWVITNSGAWRRAPGHDRVRGRHEAPGLEEQKENFRGIKDTDPSAPNRYGTGSSGTHVVAGDPLTRARQLLRHRQFVDSGPRDGRATLPGMLRMVAGVVWAPLVAPAKVITHHLLDWYVPSGRTPQCYGLGMNPATPRRATRGNKPTELGSALSATR